MVSCLVIDGNNISTQMKAYLLNDAFNGDAVEHINVADNKTIIFINNIEKEKVWEVVFRLEVEQTLVGYGFGKEREEAKNKAFDRLKVIAHV